MEFEERDEEEEEEERKGQEMGIGVSPLAYNVLGGSAARVSKIDPCPGEGGGAPERKGSGSAKYGECLRNHAVSIGGHSVDGCGEFMAAGEEGTLDALKCVACNCHRNFHRKESEDEASPFPLQHPRHHHHPQPFPPYYYRTPPPASGEYLPHPHPLHLPMGSHPAPHHPLLALPAAAASGGGGHCGEEEDLSNPSSGGSGSRPKRFRTKFTPDQKERMRAFAETLGWKLQKYDDVTVRQFCSEIGVKRTVLEIWMHNNRHGLGKKP